MCVGERLRLNVPINPKDSNVVRKLIYEAINKWGQIHSPPV